MNRIREKPTMGKYDLLWNWIQKNGEESIKLTFAEIAQIAGAPIDHSFLMYKKELQDYGYRVGRLRYF